MFANLQPFATSHQPRNDSLRTQTSVHREASPLRQTTRSGVDSHVHALCALSHRTRISIRLLLRHVESKSAIRPSAESDAMNTDRQSVSRKIRIVRGVFCVAIAALAVSPFADAQEVDTALNQQAVLVELFTSEGCSSCPPADANLKRLAQLAKENGHPIYTLSFHVDYWNDLGWNDPFSSQAATSRQKMYTKAFRLTRIYTPQFVVNGQWEFVGSNRSQTRAAILQALQTTMSAELSVVSKLTASHIEVKVAASEFAAGDRLVVALVQNEVQSKVTNGENSGRTLSHVHVVRNFKTMTADRSATVVFPKPDSVSAEDLHVLVYLQSGNDFSLMAVAKSDVASIDVAETN